MLVAPAAHHRGLNKFGPRIDVVLRAQVFTRYNPNPDYRGPLSARRVVVVNNLRRMSETADKRVYRLQGDEDVRVKWSSTIDAVYVDGIKQSFGGNMFDLLNLIDNRTLKAWDHKQ